MLSCPFLCFSLPGLGILKIFGAICAIVVFNFSITHIFHFVLISPVTEIEVTGLICESFNSVLYSRGLWT
jgi:hypothetical protein